MSIIRSPKPETNYTVVENSLINDPNLDWREIGLLVYLLSKPNNWQISQAHLATQKKMGVDGIKAALKVLQQAGYVEHKKHSTGHSDWIIYDKPKVDKPLMADPKVEKPKVEKPKVANPRLISTDLITSTEKDSKGFTLPENIHPELWARFESHRKHIKKPLSDDARVLQSNVLKKLNTEDQTYLVNYSINGGYPALYVEQLEKSNGTRRNQEIPKQPDNSATRHHDRNKRAYAEAVAEELGDPSVQQISSDIQPQMAISN